MPKYKVANTISLPALKVKFKDIFDFTEFYKALYGWYLENNWVDKEDKSEHWESFYAERIGQGGVKEVWIRWRAYKDAPDAPFLAYYLDLDFHGLGLTKTDVVKEGTKMSLDKGEVEVAIKAFIEKKYEKKFDENWLLKDVKKLFTERIYKKTLKQREKELFQEMYMLQNFMKQWFKIRRYLPYEENKSFYPSFAYPSHLKEEK